MLLFLQNILKTLKLRYPNIDIGQVVVTIPVDFKANQRQATIRACKLAGLENVQLINEPSSSIISYRKNYSDQFKYFLNNRNRVSLIRLIFFKSNITILVN